jgi:ribonuclease D
MAQCNPQSLSQLAEDIDLPAPVIQRYGEELIRLLVEQQAVLEEDLPPLLPAPLDSQQRNQVKTLKAQVRSIAGELKVAPEILLQSKDYELLLRETAGVQLQLPVHWSGWRKEAVLSALRTALTEGVV